MAAERASTQGEDRQLMGSGPGRGASPRDTSTPGSEEPGIEPENPRVTSHNQGGCVVEGRMGRSSALSTVSLRPRSERGSVSTDYSGRAKTTTCK
ncbi:unnamed protein product [Boreogadus saida]